MNYTWMVIGMALVTLFVKAVFFVLGDRIAFPQWLSRALAFVPVTVLTAIIVPMILSPHGNGLEIHLENPQLLASLVAVAVSLLSGRQLLTIASGLTAFFMLQYFFLH